MNNMYDEYIDEEMYLAQEKEHNPYDMNVAEDMVDDDAIAPEEEAFMRGYMEMN